MLPVSVFEKENKKGRLFRATFRVSFFFLLAA
jgi:hypothetical protein